MMSRPERIDATTPRGRGNGMESNGKERDGKELNEMSAGE
jgi:hypothetical protein